MSGVLLGAGAQTSLVLRDIHQPPAPPWWPPAPGWWLLAAALLLVILGVAWLAARRRRRRRAIAALFDRAVVAAPTPSERVAVMSELLRRAARRRDPAADKLQGEVWLAFLDDGGKPVVPGCDSFRHGAGRLLLEGGYRPDTDTRDVDALQAVARVRYLDWMGSR
ncbi:DUF4381 family protein [Lysobacter sp. D1-1-M9]|uniref:DUF4381 family protein n=1 Tax=Novilysobacter longmucuonensis TaxID=3098603 RepID=UPI002FC9AADB